MTDREKKALLVNDIIEAHESGLLQWSQQKPLYFWKTNFKGIELALFAYKQNTYPFFSCNLNFFNDEGLLSYELFFPSCHYPELIPKVLATLITLPTEKEPTELDKILKKTGALQKITRGEKIHQIINVDQDKVNANQESIKNKLIGISIISMTGLLAGMYFHYYLKSAPLTLLASFYSTITIIWHIKAKSY